MNLEAPILVTGATGYVGGRLVPRLLERGYRGRAMGRSLEKLACRTWATHERVELVTGDVLVLAQLVEAAQGCRAAVYLVHAMIARQDRYAEADRHAARNMRTAADRAGLEQIIYLGGLGDANHPKLTRHLASRHEVGDILQSSAVPATILRAAMILGSGSASFEILRYLVEYLPVMITPRWVHTPTQPIAIENVLAYLIGCLENEATRGGTFDIGGPDVLTYKDLIHLYAQEAGLSDRIIVPVPLLTPKLSARWIHLVTPVPAAIALPLTEGLRLPTTCKDFRIRQMVAVNLIDCKKAIHIALDRILSHQVESCWKDAGALRPPEWAACGDAEYAGGTILKCAYRIRLDGPPENIWPHLAGIGGERGYYFGNALWRLRGTLDRWMGGVGLRRGRRHPMVLQVGDALDFWRVVSMVPFRRLSLMAEMKMPGEALLDLQLLPLENRRTELRMISRFLPRGLGGRIYWYVLYPFHVWLFRGMLRAIAAQTGSRNNVMP
ncbi:MAG: SDR family oxidoreductase, partial [Desulfatitalea sp.]|nr:SDR family oxidoreductase [Desulfatitalea sp.]